MIVKFTSRFLVVTLMLTAFVGQVNAAPDQKTFVVGVLADFQPQYLRKSNGEPGGFAVDSFDQIALRAGIDYRYRFLEDWDAMFTSLRIGEIDIIPNLGITPERLKLFAFTQSLEQFELGLFVLSSATGLSGIDAMAGKTVAVIERNVGVKLIKRNPDIESRVYQHVEQALFALLAGDIDGFIYPIPVVNRLIERHHLNDQIRLAGPSILTINRALAVRKEQKGLLEQQLNEAVADFVESPEYQAIYQRWHEDGEFAPKVPSKQPQLSGAGGVALVLFVVVIALLMWLFRHSSGLRQLLPVDVGKAAIFLALVAIILIVVITKVPEDKLKSIPKISVVHLSKVDSSTYAGFLVQMKERDYLQGSNIDFIYKGAAGSIDKLDGMIQDHLALDPDLILVSSTPGTLAVKRLTAGTDIPVVFAPVNDPLDAGIVPDLQHPGGHITGVRLPTGDDLRLQWLGRIAPNIHKVYVPYTQGDKSAAATIQQIKAVAPQLGLKLIIQPLASDATIHGDGSVVPEDIDAIFLPRDSTIEARIDEFVKLANGRRLPLSAPSEKQVVAGALFTYGFVHYEIGRQAGQLVDQILRGTPPAELPVLMAENYLLINMKAAQQIELKIPETVLHQANRLIR